MPAILLRAVDFEPELLGLELQPVVVARGDFVNRVDPVGVPVTAVRPTETPVKSPVHSEVWIPPVSPVLRSPDVFARTMEATSRTVPRAGARPGMPAIHGVLESSRTCPVLRERVPSPVQAVTAAFALCLCRREDAHGQRCNDCQCRSEVLHGCFSDLEPVSPPLGLVGEAYGRAAEPKLNGLDCAPLPRVANCAPAPKAARGFRVPAYRSVASRPRRAQTAQPS